MSKTAVTQLFIGSIGAVGGGLVLLLISVIVGVVYDGFVMDGPDVVGIHSTSGGIGVVLLAAVATLAIIGGAIGQFVAWLGAVLNTVQPRNKTWFIMLLFLGLLSFGFVAILLYVLAGPDGMTASASQASVAPRPIGQDRAGFLSNDYLENLTGADIHNADALRPEWQQRALGDRVRMASPGERALGGNATLTTIHILLQPTRVSQGTGWPSVIAS